MFVLAFSVSICYRLVYVGVTSFASSKHDMLFCVRLRVSAYAFCRCLASGVGYISTIMVATRGGH